MSECDSMCGAMSGEKVGVLLMNTGTADEPSVEAIRRYLGEFLMDPAIIGAPYPIRKLIVSRILKSRPQKTLPNYKRFWTEQGSPFILASEEQARKLELRLGELLGVEVPVALAMRYGNPSIAHALLELRSAGCNHVVILPSYPQEVKVCAGTCINAAKKVLKELESDRWSPRVAEVPSFYEQPAYRKALCESIASAWTYRPGAKLLVSFHSTMLADIEAGDPYKDQTEATRRMLVEDLNIPAEDVLLSYQSRFDNRKWLSPFTEPTVVELARQGVKDLCVVCPGFTACNIETAVEVEEELRETFLNAAGEGAVFTHVPELDASDGLIDAMAQEILEKL